MVLMLSQISFRDNILQEEKYKYIFSVEAVNELVNKKIPFRQAYQEVGNSINKGVFQFDASQPLYHTHVGSLGNLSNEKIQAEMAKAANKIA
jgi:argininosuccinate lyase